MAIWQFTTLAALIGALLISVMVLTNKLSASNAMLKRIEEALLSTGRVEGNVPATAGEATAIGAMVMEATAAELAAVGASPAPEGPATLNESGTLNESATLDDPVSDRRVNYLTVRDLKVMARAGRRFEDRLAPANPFEAVSMGPAPIEPVAVGSAAGEPVSIQAAPIEPVPVESAAYEPVSIQPAPIEAAPVESAANEPVADIDPALEDRKKRDALLIMSAQRRRRRARGY